MKPRKIQFILTATSILLLAPAAFAVDGSWSNTAGGSWNTDTNWTGGPPGVIADGSGFTATFSALDIAADTTVTLDAARTIGNLIFGDTDTSSAASWLLATGTEGKLTLDATTPTITVNALGATKNAQITATLEGNKGFTKAGAGTLVLNNITNTISGPVVVSAGNLSIQSRPLISASSVAINAGSLVVATTAVDAIGGTISFGGGTLQYNSDPGSDLSAQFSTAASQSYRINVQSGKTATFSSDLASAGGTLTKLATGTLILSAANTYSGITSISGGTLEVQGSIANSVSTTITTGAALVFNSALAQSYGNVISGAGTLAKRGDGTLTLSGANTFSGGTTVNGGVLSVSANNNLGATPGSATPGNIVINGGTNSLTKTGSGSLTLSVANSYTGGTILNQGILNYGNALALSSGPIRFTGASILQAGVATTLANPISVDVNVIGTIGTSSFATFLSGAITGTGILAKGGTNTLNLTGGEANTISGGIQVFSGRLNVLDGLSLTNVGPVTVDSGASLNYSKNFLLDDDLANNITISGPGNGTFGALNLQGNVDATGAITLAGDATITHNFNNATISGSITGTNRTLTLTTVNPAQAGLVISAPISLGSGGIIVNSAGGTNTVTLSGTNSYSGETRVATGTLVLSGSARINNSSTVRIDSGAVLNLDFAGPDVVGALFLPGDPNPKPDGTYGSPTSAATNKSADFAGDGILQVGGGGNNYASWATTNSIPGEPFEGDFNKDGITNGVAYALGLSPTVSSQPAGVLSGSTITFTKGADAISNGDVTWIIETSLTLSGSWLEEVVQTPGNATATISYNLNPDPGTPKKFARLKAVKMP